MHTKEAIRFAPTASNGAVLSVIDKMRDAVTAFPTPNGGCEGTGARVRYIARSFLRLALHRMLHRSHITDALRAAGRTALARRISN